MSARYHPGVYYREKPLEELLAQRRALAELLAVLRAAGDGRTWWRLKLERRLRHVERAIAEREGAPGPNDPWRKSE